VLSFASATGGVTASLALQGGPQVTGVGSVTLAGFEHMTGSGFGDTLTGDAGANVLSGGAGVDLLNGDGGADTLVGGLDNDTLNGGDGDDILDGGQGDDILDGGSGVNTVSFASSITSVGVDLAGRQAVQAMGAIYVDTLSNLQNIVGSAYADTLSGDGGANSIDGRAGNDSLEGRGGDDILDGGAGINTAVFLSAETGVTVSLALQGQAQATGVGSDTLLNIQNLIGSQQADTLTGDAGANTMRGADGADILIGGDGNDTLFGGEGDDLLEGGAGDDILVGEGGVNTASYASAASAVTVKLTLGAQVTGADTGRDTLNGIRNLVGSAHADVLTGDGNANVISGGSGDDVIDGGGGNDTLEGGAGVNIASFASATSGVTVTLALQGSAQTTGAGSDTLSNFQNLTGSAFADVLVGDAGANVILGGAGNDLIRGGGGVDRFTGGAGADTFVFLATFSGQSLITDFLREEGDRIDVSNYVNFRTLASILSLTSQVGGDTQISLGSNILTLTSVSRDSLVRGDFVLGANTAPVAAISNQSLSVNRSVSVSSLLTYSDSDGDLATQYRFRDDGSSLTSGYFSVNGARQDSGANITVSASDLARVQIHGGSVAGTETLSVQAYDGQEWGAWSTFNLTTVANRKPVVTAVDHVIAPKSTNAVGNWLSYSDADGDAAVRYRMTLEQPTSTGSWVSAFSGQPTLFSTLEGAGQTPSNSVDVSAAQLDTVILRGGRVASTQSLLLQAYDGETWGDATRITITTLPNHAPVSTLANQTVRAGQTVAISSVLSVTDAEGDTIAGYRFWDGGAATTSGYFSAAGVSRAGAGVNIEVAAADFGSVVLHAGSAAGSETLWVQAHDGVEWGQWKSFVLTTTVPVNAKPVATVPNQTLGANGAASLSSLLAYTDADNDAVVQFRFWDGGTDSASGYFSTAANAREAAGSGFLVSAGSLSSVQLHAGAASGTETMWVQAFDGNEWGGWSSFTLTTNLPVNRKPTIGIANQTLGAGGASSVAGLLTYADADNDAATLYKFWDGGAAATSGYFSTTGNSREAAGVDIIVSAANLSGVQLHAGSVSGAETLWVQVFDGKAWSDWKSFVLTSALPVNAKPVATMSDRALAANATTSVAGLLTYADADNDAAVQYRFWDDGAASSSGYVSIGGVRQAAGANITVNAADLGGVLIHGGSAAGSETLWVQAYDGKEWGAWDSFVLTTTAAAANNKPVATIADRSLSANATVSASSLIAYSDADGDAATQYRFWDDGTASSSGYISVGGVRQGTGANITVNAADLGGVLIHGGSAAGSETLWVQVYDGKEWGAWDAFVLTTTAAAANNKPVATIADRSLSANATVSASSLIAYSDSDGDAATQYRFWDDGTASSSGYISVGGVRQGTGANITVNAADLGGVLIRGGSAAGSETLWVQVYDGKEWGAWDSFVLTTTAAVANNKPVATIADRSLSANATVSASSLIAYSDADGDAATQYRFWDDGTASSSGYISVGGVRQGTGANITVNAADLGGVLIRGGSAAGSETLWVQAYDGKEWGVWDPFILTTTLV
jgi:Ca2+-binding RTX toxin-like protein